MARRTHRCARARDRSAAPPCSRAATRTTDRSPAAVANDYRLRHPIAIKEGARTVELFIGNKRGGLNGRSARRRARLRRQLAARGDRRHPHRRAGRHAQRGRRGQCRARGPLDPVGRRRAAACRRGAPVSAGRSRQARHAPAQLSDDDGRGRAVRAVAARSRPDRRPRAQREQAVLEPRLRLAAQSRRHGRQPGRPGAAARRDPALYRSPHHRARQVPPRRKPRRPSIPDKARGKISDVGK